MEFFKLADTVLWKCKVVMHGHGGSGMTGTTAAAYWIDKGLSASDALKKARASNPAAVEDPEQEKSLYYLEAILKCKS